MYDGKYKVNVYVDINPITKKIFYVGIGSYFRVSYLKRNSIHQKIVNSLPDNYFIRKIIYKMIPLEKAWKIEKQIIKKCGRLVTRDGYLSNIDAGGKSPGRHKYINLRKGKSYEEQYGKNKDLIIKKQVENRLKSKRLRMEKVGKTEKEIKSTQQRIERRKNKQFTERELESFKKISERQQGKKMRERLNNPNWVNPSKGKTAIEIYGENYNGPPNKGKTYKEMKGEDCIFPTAKPFFIQIDDETPIFCESESFFCKTFNSYDTLLRKFKKSKENGHKITRQLNSSHYFSDKSIIKLIPCNIEDNPKLDINIINDIINRQKEKIENWIFLKNNKTKHKTKKYLNFKYKFPFNIIINDNEPVYCLSETDCCNKFKCDRSLLGRIKKLPNMTYHMKKRAGSAKHIFPDNSVIRIEYIK
jgi:hypothetical protein